MAMIDYGAILRVDGKFINKNKEMFMETSDTGYEPPEKAIYPDYGNINIRHNYFVYAGDKNFLLCFYKTGIVIVSNGKVIVGGWGFGTPFKEETFFIDNFPSIKISHLDKQKYPDDSYILDDFDKGIIESDRRNNKKKQIRIWHKIIKRLKRWHKNKSNYYYSNRYIATWSYNGHHYECIYGYGIDPNEDCWNDIKYTRYDFSDTERGIIDSWFRSE